MAIEEKLVNFDEVEAAYNDNPTNTLKELIDRMSKLDQSKVELSVFTKATEIMECQKCGRVLGTSNYDRLTEKTECYGSICHNCEDRIETDVRSWRKRVKVKEQWRTLATELQKFSKHYRFVPEVEGNFHGDHIIIVDPEDKTIYARIQRETYGGRKWPYKSKRALRVYSSEYSVKYDRLRADFDGKGITKRIHDKCLDVIQQIKNLKWAEKESNKAYNLFKQMVEEKWGDRKLRFRNNCTYTVWIDGVKVLCYNMINDDVKTNFVVADIKTRDEDYDWESNTTVYFPEEAVLPLVDTINKYRSEDE